MRLPRFFTPRTVVSAHCDLPCGVYDPAQARIEAESVKAICEKYQANTRPRVPHPGAASSRSSAPSWSSTTCGCCGPTTSSRRTSRSTRNLHQLFNEATKLAGAAGAKGSVDPAVGRPAARQDRRDRQDLLGDQAGLSVADVRDPAGTSRGRAGRRRDGARTRRVTSGRRSECHLTDGAARTRPCSAAPPALFCHVAVDAGDEPVGFALWFLNFSTWEGVHGIYLEDLYVRPAARGTGAGRALLAALAAICVERGYRRLEWWVLRLEPGARVLRRARRRADGRVGAVPARPATALRALAAPLAERRRCRPVQRDSAPVRAAPGGLRRRRVRARGFARDTASRSTPSPATTWSCWPCPPPAPTSACCAPRRPGLAARLQFTLDEIEDLRIAVDEACAMLLADRHRVRGAAVPFRGDRGRAHRRGERSDGRRRPGCRPSSPSPGRS